jgi:hypothetical protein
LFSDTVILQYLNDAQRILAERTHCLLDEATYTVTTAAGTRSYTLPDTVLSVVAAKIDGETDPLVRGFLHPLNNFFGAHQSVPKQFTMTGGPHKISFNPTPDAVYTVRLVCAVKPAEAFGANDDPVVPESTHTALTYYAASLCLLHNDVDGLNVASSESLSSQFNLTVRDLKREVYSQRVGPDANVVPMRIAK